MKRSGRSRSGSIPKKAAPDHTSEAERFAEPRGLIKRSILRRRAEPDFRTLFESAPGLYLVLEPDIPQYTIVAVSDAYLRATMRQREDIIGRGIFEVFPDNAGGPEATGVRDCAASLGRVVRNRTVDAMAVQRHDVRRPEAEGGALEERSWSLANYPVFGREGNLIYILQRVEDVTEFVRLEQAGIEAQRSTAELGANGEERERLLAEIDSERRWLKGVFDIVPIGILLFEPGGRLNFNRRTEELLGMTPSPSAGSPQYAHQVLFPDGRSVPRDQLVSARVLRSGETVIGEEYVIQRPDGSRIPVLGSAAPLRDADGQVVGGVGVFQDVSERMRMEESRRRDEDALRLSEAKFSGIIAISADAIISIDDAERITMFNEGAENIFGYSKAEIIGSPLEALIPERFRQDHRQHVKRFAEGQATARRMGMRNTEIFGLRKNGEEFPADAAISKLEIGGKKLLTVSMRDVSEQKLVENEQRLLAEIGKILITAGSDYQRLLTDVANMMVRNIADWCSVDIVQEGDVWRLRIVHSDRGKAAICDALERYPIRRERPSPVAEVLDTQASVLMSDVPPEYLESLAQSAEHLRLIRALDPGSFIVVPLVARGQSLGTLGLGRSRASRRYGPQDLHVVERIASRVALAVDNARLHEALERAVRARDEVLGIVAHDLRNPLNSIILQAHALRRRGDEPERRDQKAPERIHRAALRMNSLIQDLLDVTRLEAGQRLSITQDDIPTASVLTEAVEQQQAAISASDRRLNVDAAGVPPRVWADRTRLLQVFDNLLGNAIKFSRQLITVGASTKDAEALFWVADDGAGVSAEDQPRVFDRFWQATRADRRGAGLGLSIVKGIVDAHGGRIWVESEVGVGTTFYFTLPVAPRTPSRS